MAVMATSVARRVRRVAGGDIASEQDKNLCDWFAKLVEDVNAGEIRGTASAEPAMVGETLYRINTCTGCR